MNYSFFAMISRMKYIDRWALMRNTDRESLDSHSKEVAVIAHALAIIGNKRFGKGYNADRAAVLGLYHDAHEIITGDMPTPVKYQNDDILVAFKAVEESANQKLLSKLPEDLRDEFSLVLDEAYDEELKPLVKAADKISALIKCIEERKAGNTEFREAESATRQRIIDSHVPEANVFMEEFLPAYEQTLDML
ncbi:MAG: 5'-deoxynucleotidase [Ruminococcaceae bacterium]|nr:5'-deoxynucleotidase [Oscillospiraceae bacterium]